MKKIFPLVLFTICCLFVAAAAQKKGKAPAAGGAGRSVVISNFQFTPKTVTVKAGATVTWNNQAGVHTVTADDNSWASPTLNNGQTFSRRFARPGTYRYHCAFHGSPGGEMSGVVNVVR
jgi:plastocyanin